MKNAAQDKCMQGKRIVLRQAVLDDVFDMVEYNSEELFRRYTLMSEAPTFLTTKIYIQNRIARSQEIPRKLYHFCIVDIASQKVIGDINLSIKDIEKNIASIGYALSPSYWNRGYMSEAINLALNFFFNELNVSAIYATCVAENIGSIRVLEKNGFTLQGNTQNHPKSSIVVYCRYRSLP